MESGLAAMAAGRAPGYRSESNAIDQGQFNVLMQNLEELRNTLTEAAARLESKTIVLLGKVPQPGPPQGKTDAGPAPNGVIQSMTWGVRDMIQTVVAMHDQINRIDQSGIGAS